MDRINLIVISMGIVLHFTSTVYGQNVENTIKAKASRFARTNDEVLGQTLNISYYPNKTGDFWEYIVRDTTTLLGQLYELNFSITKEVFNDTLMANGKVYKKIKWENVANSISYLPWYEYHRVDSTGNVFLYYNGQDYLLFDFSLAIGQTYSSHIPNHIWKISNKYNVIGFGDTLKAIDYELYEAGTLIKEKYTVAEKFGIIYYHKNILGYAVPEGNFWGAIIDGKEFGTMIVKKQIVDWNEFYPLHVGDFWIYSSSSGSINSILTRLIIKDTVMADFNNYSVAKTINYTFEDTSFSYTRVDSLGNVYSWESWSSSSKRTIRLNNIIGDTIGIQESSASCWRINSKSDSSIKFFLFPDFVYASNWYTKGLGLTDWTIEGGGGYLVGAVINGLVYGDTTITDIINEKMNYEIGFNLYQNYPNPFNPLTTIYYDVKESGFVNLSIFDILGREVANLVSEDKAEGHYSIDFNASNLPSGVYIYTIRVNDFVTSKKMTLLK